MTVLGYKPFYRDKKGLYTKYGDGILRFEVGKSYSISSLNKYSFKEYIFSKTVVDVFCYTPLVNNIEVYEILASGDIESSSDFSKYCKYYDKGSGEDITRESYVASKIKILEKKVDIEKVLDSFSASYPQYYIDKKITNSKYVVDSTLIYRGENISSSQLIFHSDFVTNSVNIGDSYNIISSSVVSDSSVAQFSQVILYSKFVKRSECIYHSSHVTDSENVSFSRGVYKSRLIFDSVGVESSSMVRRSFGIRSSEAVSDALFLYEKEAPPPYTIFSKEVGYTRYREVSDELFKLLEDWHPIFDEFEVNYHIKRDYRKNAWGGMPDKAIQYIKNLKEFNKDMFYDITNISL